jgi:hypothetical protein
MVSGVESAAIFASPYVDFCAIIDQYLDNPLVAPIGGGIESGAITMKASLFVNMCAIID